jgi:hypothetical protein
MRGSSVAILVVLLFVAVAAHAGSIPTFTATQGAALLSPGAPYNVPAIVHYSFSGKGFSLTGMGDIACGFCASQPPFDTGMTIFGDGLDSLIVGGTSYTGVLSLSSSNLTFGPSFSPPANQSAFSITLPVRWHGTIFSCQASTLIFQECASDPTTGNELPLLATINFNAKGTATLNYTQQNGYWTFNSGTFILSPVPEPGTFVLMGSGLTALIGFVRRRG